MLVDNRDVGFGIGQFARSNQAELVKQETETVLMSRAWRVPEGTRLLDFQITTRTLLEKFYYSIE